MNAILIPAYKPDEKLIALCDQLVTYEGIKVVVVDDGSGEECRLIFNALNPQVHLISYPVNKGKGGALKTGIKYIYESMPDCDCLVTADADGQHRYEDICKVFEKSVECPGSLVLGGRRFDETNVPFRSKAGNAITRKIFKLVSGAEVYDTQTGLRGFDRKGMELFMDVPGDRYEYEINVLLKAVEKGMPIHEITIATVYLEENKSSHFNPFKDSARIYKCLFKHAGLTLLKFAASSFIAFLIDYFGFLILHNPIGDVAANIVSRIVSATANFIINKEVVFKSKENVWRAALKYALLAIAVLAVDTVILKLIMIEWLNIPEWIAKPITEIVMFFINYPMQRKFVYKKTR